MMPSLALARAQRYVASPTPPKVTLILQNQMFGADVLLFPIPYFETSLVNQCPPFREHKHNQALSERWAGSAYPQG